ncbi:hypothetical protein RUND412_001036 [Rhizina undulata]
MLTDAPHSFIYLPGERALYQSPVRTSFTLSSMSSFPASRPFSISCSSGVLHLTTQRIVYTLTDKTPNLESFSCPLTHLHDTHVYAPFFGPNTWSATVQPVSNGGIPQTSSAVELKLVFKDGGAFDFHSMLERVKERVRQTLENSQPGLDPQVALSRVHMEDLPAYEPVGAQAGGGGGARTVEAVEMDGPPPGYEEVQRDSVAMELERQAGR